jgi:pimeloyl-ACP methyl ester carboxylesterase
VIQGGGHDVNEEHHERVNAEIVSFLSSVISA